jgi:hypothetical protein
MWSLYNLRRGRQIQILSQFSWCRGALCTLWIKEARGFALRCKKQSVWLVHSTGKIRSMHFVVFSISTVDSRALSLSLPSSLRDHSRDLLWTLDLGLERKRGSSCERRCAFREPHLLGIRTIKLKSRYADKWDSRTSPFGLQIERARASRCF